jgi:hypothetical protein
MLKLEWLREFIRSDFYYEDGDLEEQNVVKEASEEIISNYRLQVTN